MKMKNQIINYFAALPHHQDKSKHARVFKSPVTMSHEVAKDLLQKQLETKGEKLRKNALLHICYDLDSQRLYSPNAHLFEEKIYRYLLQATKNKIIKDYGEIASSKVIPGSPFSSIRLRKIDSFVNVYASIIKSFPEIDFRNLNVVEASLERMPYTRKQLPPEFAEGSTLTGGLISEKFAKEIKFLDQLDIDGKKRKTPIPLLAVQTPFVLIDTSPKLEIENHDKEWTILTSYQQFVKDSIDEGDLTSHQEDLYSIKNLLFLGFPFEEVCSFLLKSVRRFPEFIKASNLILQTVDAVVEAGGKNPTQFSYYINFKVPKNKFPINIDSIRSADSNKFDSSKQLPYLKIVEYNESDESMILESPIFLDESFCTRIFKAEGNIVISKYNPSVDKIDIKSSEGVFKHVGRNTKQVAKLKALNTFDIYKAHPEKRENKERVGFRADERSRAINISGGNISHLRNISDYDYAYRFIKNMCEEEGVEFRDLPVLVGPLERLMGRGTKGGFISESNWKKSNFKIPHEMEKGLWVSPPIIAVDSVSAPSYAAQGSTLIHEYSHYIYSLTNPEHEHEYLKEENRKEQQESTNKFWYLYLTDPDERKAHLRQIVYELKAGHSADEIIRDKVGGRITNENYAKSLKFKELVDEAIAIIENEEEASLDIQPNQSDNPNEDLKDLDKEYNSLE